MISSVVSQTSPSTHPLPCMPQSTHAHLLLAVLCNGKRRKVVFRKPVKAGGLDVFLEASVGDVAEGEDLADTVFVVGSVVPFPVVNGDDAVDFGGNVADPCVAFKVEVVSAIGKSGLCQALEFNDHVGPLVPAHTYSCFLLHPSTPPPPLF